MSPTIGVGVITPTIGVGIITYNHSDLSNAPGVRVDAPRSNRTIRKCPIAITFIPGGTHKHTQARINSNR